MTKLLYGMLTVLLVMSLCLGQTSSDIVYPYWRSQDFSWTREEIVTEDKQFATIVANLDRLLKEGANPSSVRKRFEPKPDETYESQPINDRFSWAYLTYQMLRRPDGIPIKVRENQITHARHLLAIKPTSNAHDYIRLRFLLPMYLGVEERLLPVGRKLLALNPNDLALRYSVAAILAVSHEQADLDKAEGMVQTLIASYPTDSSYRSLEASIAWSKYIKSGGQANGQHAIELYADSYMNSNDSQWKRRARTIINYISSDMMKRGFKVSIPAALKN